MRNFVVSTVLARLLMPEDFGLLGMAMVFAGLTDAFVDFGFGNAIIQKQKTNLIQLSTVFWINMLMALILTAIMFLTSPWVALYFEMPDLKSITQLMSLTFIIKGLTSLQSALFRKELNYKIPFYIEIIGGVISGVLGIYWAYIGYGVYSLIYSQISGWIISTLLIWHFSKWKPSFVFNLNTISELWGFGYKYSLSIFIDSAFSKMDTIIIGKMFSATVLGLFYKAQSLNNLIIQLAFSSFGNVLFPSLSKLAYDKEKLKDVMTRILHIVCFTTFLFSGLMFINAKSIIIILFTDRWIGSIDIFRLLAVFSFIYTLPTILTTPILSIGKSGDTLKIEIIKKALYLLAIPSAIYLGLYAYISSVILAAIVGILVNLYLVKKYLNYQIWDFVKLFSKYFIPFMFFIGIDFYMPHWIQNNYLNIITKSIIYIIYYLSINSILKTKGYNETFLVVKNIVNRKT